MCILLPFHSGATDGEPNGWKIRTAHSSKRKSSHTLPLFMPRRKISKEVSMAIVQPGILDEIVTGPHSSRNVLITLASLHCCA